MKLTKEQIQEVENYLTNKDVEYVDLHLEVLDHISSDVENLMNDNQLNFNEAFEEVKEKWNEVFSYKWSYWLGISNGGSKLFIDHCLRIYRPILIKIALSLLASIIFFSIYYKKLEVNLASYQTIGKYMFLIFSILYVALIYIWKHKINDAGKTTTYYYLYKKTVMPNVAFSVLLILQVILFDKNVFDVSILLFSIVFLLNLYTGFTFYKNHIQTIEKYKMA